MRIVNDKNRCCGCGACAVSCPMLCITMEIDKHGFYYPLVNKSKCINCGLCKNVCIYKVAIPSCFPNEVYAAKAKDVLVRNTSSSGGVFSLLAQYVILNGGIVFGAAFNEESEVCHIDVADIKNLDLLQRSKYVQSITWEIFKRVKSCAVSNRLTLFSGTPCQCIALKLYLQKEYSNLIIVDVACHGVPSPKIWKQWLAKVKKENNIGRKAEINFRYKKPTAKMYSFLLSDGLNKVVIKRKDNSYMNAFYNNLFLRPSCYNCIAKGKFNSDITLADYWGLQYHYPEFEDNKGVSMVLLNSIKGKEIFSKIDVDKVATECAIAVDVNTTLVKSVKGNPKCAKFWSLYDTIGIDALDIMLAKSNRYKLLKRIKSICIKIVRQLKFQIKLRLL